MTRPRHHALLALALLVGSPAMTPAEPVTTADVVTRTNSGALACMAWQPVGLCFWLRCGAFGCDVETSLKVGHYAPDLVVSVYNELGANPWTDVGAALGGAQQAAVEALWGAPAGAPADGGVNREVRGRHLLYREVDAIGHPLGGLAAVPYFGSLACPSPGATPFFPHFLASLDALSWRGAIPEMLYPASLVPGLREIGHWPLNTWGSVYPRTGWTVQTDEVKSAAVAAQRAGDIVTRPGQPHIYVPVRTGGATFAGNQRVWLPPRPLTENDRGSGWWQMLAPIPDASCRVFGENDLAMPTSWGGGRVDTGGDYVWNLWRPYKCCQRRGHYLFDIDFVPFP